MAYGSNSGRTPRKPIYDVESGVPPTEAQVERMKRQAGNVAKYWLEQQRLSVAEMRTKLLKKKLIDEVVEWKLAELVEQGLLNDASLLEDFVFYRQGTLSERAMRMKLLKRGLDVEAVDEALLEVDEAEQLEAAERVAGRRARGTLREQDERKRRGKIVQSVVTKGFSMDLASKLADKAIEEHPVTPLTVALEGESDEEAAAAVEEAHRAAAFKLAEAKARGVRSRPPAKQLQSVIQSLIRKGYNFALAREAAEAALNGEASE